MRKAKSRKREFALSFSLSAFCLLLENNMNAIAYLFQDRKANANNFKGQLVLFLFRLASLINRSMLAKVILYPYLLWYRYVVDWVWGIELPRKLKAGKGLII